MPMVTAGVVEGQLRRLEDRVFNRVQLPGTWEQFVSGTYIRSGKQMKQYVPYKYQRALVHLMGKIPNITVVKTRQIGVSQVYASRFLFQAAKNKAFTGLVFLPTQDDVSGISKRVGEMLSQNRWGLEPATDNIKRISVSGGGNIYFRGTGGKSAARGTDSVAAVGIDEIAFCTNAETVMGAALASTALTGDSANIITLSTPDVSSGLFYDLLQSGTERDIEDICEDVKHGRLFTFGIPGFYHEVSKDGMSAVVVIHHTAHPVYNQLGREAFLAYRQSVEKVPYATILREYDLCFNVVGSSLLNPMAVKKAADLEPLTGRPTRDGLYEYFVGVDASTGGRDYCVCIVLRRHRVTRRVDMVACYRERKSDSYKYLKDIKTLLTTWRPAMTCIETNGAGKVFLDHLSHDLPEFEYVGFNSHPRSKIQLFNQLAFELDAELLHIWHKHPIARELVSLKDYGAGDIRCASTKDAHDDLAFGLAFAVQAYYALYNAE
jgi:hypothetical protein